ncbi:hypothetical protein CRUP_019055 [Coryphaenoides rupestris]|nr:hypothetical protein CRUP_019055 [Coryphaenoides rupestris]
MASLRRPYQVTRPLYSEASFADEHDKIYRHRKTLWNHVRQYFTWDARRLKNAALSLLPIIGWMRDYRVKQWLLGDLLSGVSTGLVSVMQGLAFALLASLPPIYGLYTAFFPMLIYFFLGTSRHISVGKLSRLTPKTTALTSAAPSDEGAFPVLSLMVGAVVLTWVPESDPAANNTMINNPMFPGYTPTQQRVIVASSLTFMVGLFQLGMGLLQLGFVVKYLSDTLVSGFTTAAAVHILVSQLKFILGLDVPGLNGILAIIYTLEGIFKKITSTNICDLVTSIVIMAVVFVVKELNDRFKAKLPVPIPIETVVACAVSYVAEFEATYGVKVVGDLGSGYETPVAPDVRVMSETVIEAFPIAIVGFAVAFSVAKVYSVKHGYTIDGNQELIAFGVSNIFGASFKSFAASTALSRSAIQESSGGKTQSVLGALVIVNLKGMLMQVTILPSLWRKDKPDFVVWLVTCVASILLGLDIGLGVGLGIELITVVFRTQLYARRTLLLLNHSVAQISEPKGVIIFKIPSPIFFANVDFFREKLHEAVGDAWDTLTTPPEHLDYFVSQVRFNPLKVLRKRNKAKRKIDKFLKKIRSVEGDGKDSGTYKVWDTSGEKPPDYSTDPSAQIDWNGPLPNNISVPRVELHSLVLDFSTVSFLDIAGVIGLKTVWLRFTKMPSSQVLKEFNHIGVEVYIVACDECLLEKLDTCAFFDDQISKSIFFPSLHDAMLTIQEKHLDSVVR